MLLGEPRKGEQPWPCPEPPALRAGPGAAVCTRSCFCAVTATNSTEAELQIAALGSKPHSGTCQRMVRARCSLKGAEQPYPCLGRAPGGSADPRPSGSGSLTAEAWGGPGEAHQDNQRACWRTTTFLTDRQLCWCPLAQKEGTSCS